jgi:CO/xanthine dehydrogenase FAD-binding subunit
MIPKHKFIKAENLDEVLKLLNENEGAKLIAGGTDIIPGFHIESARFKDIKFLIDINRIKDFKLIQLTDDHLSIGASSNFTQIINDPLVNKYFPILVKAVSQIGSHQIRNRATIGGNFINNAPCADSVPALLIYDANLEIRSIDETKEIPLSEFLIKQYQTALNKNEVVTKIKFPLLKENYSGKFYKLGRRRGVAISRISLAVLMRQENGIIEDIRIACGAVTPIGTRFNEIEAMMKSKAADSKLFKEAAQKIGEHILELTGLRWSSIYKLPVVQQKIYQLLEEINFEMNSRTKNEN